MIDAGPKFYVVWSPTQYMTLRSRSRTLNFCIEVCVLSFYNVCFCEAFDGLIYVWHGDRNWSKISYGTIPNPEGHRLRIFIWMFYNFIFFAKPSMDFIQLWRDNRALSEILCSTIPISVHDLKIKVTDFEFFCVKTLQCQLLQGLWLIWIVFAMNGYKILKCFRKENRVSGELPCPATGLILLVLLIFCLHHSTYCVTSLEYWHTIPIAYFMWLV